MRYLLGVDGGNTKTDYLLCTEDGQFVDVYRCGSCSHEAVEDSFAGMERVMREQLSVILDRNRISVADIAAGGFGLAGADLPSQIRELTQRVKNIGFTQFTVANDGILGIKAASESGTGLCVVNGTGTVVVGIDADGEILQVSGVGDVSGDQAGGGYILRQVMYHLYAYHYRCGADSAMFGAVMDTLGVKKEDLLAVVGDYELLHRHTVDIIKLADRAAQDGDAVAMKIFDETGVAMGHSAAGCIRLLHFGAFGTEDNPLPVVLVGSIWHKIAYKGMKEVFADTLTGLSKKVCKMIPLEAPAAVGGVLWAKEMLLPSSRVEPSYRKKILESLTLERYESLVYKA